MDSECDLGRGGQPAGSGRRVPDQSGTLQSRFGTPPTRAVLVHQPGKVGSSSLYQSMLYSLPVPSYQTHAMNREIPYLSDDALERYDDESAPWPTHVRKAQRFVYHYLRPGRPIAVVTMVRDPIARNVSAFFQNISESPHLADPSDPPPVEEYQRVFLESHDHGFMDRWFDYHLREPFGVDWFAQAFDPEIGHASIAHGKNTYLLMQLELPDETKERVIREFLNFDAFRLDVTANVGEQKEYADVYRRFKQLPLPGEYLDRMCRSRVATHFYTPEQVERFRAKWEQPGVARHH
ncbi:MAG TPA: hypothetical protein ENJ00_11005 [Phycisphaerales bacterium]|nr:hypothetical protein [Phycisphaerales bacterium]